MSENVARFRAIYDAQYHRLFGYALRRTGTPEDAADVVAETFLTAWRRLGEVPEGDDARLWLYCTARKVLANHHRGRARHHRLVERLGSVPSPLSTEDGPELVAIGSAFRRLSELDRELLLLVGWEELTVAQVATVLGCTQGAARVRLHRARGRFERELAREGVKRTGPAGHDRSSWAPAQPDTQEAR